LRKACLSGIAAAALLLPASARSELTVLYLSYNAGGTDVLYDLLHGDARFDLSSSAVRNDTPTVADMLAYDRVLVCTDAVPSAGLGEALADYVDAGGYVVLTTFVGYMDFYGNFEGRIFDTGYSPLTDSTNDVYEPATLGTVLSGSPIMEGITSLSSSYYNSDWLGVDDGAVVHAQWSNGRPLVATSATGHVAAVTLYPDVVNEQNVTGDYRLLFANTLAQPNAVPEPASMTAVGVGGLLLLRRRRLK
jgi:hypothetical protein